MNIKARGMTIKIGVFVIVFFLTMPICSVIVNKGNVEMTTQMGMTSAPIIQVDYHGIKINQLSPYVNKMETSYKRDTITPVDEEREIIIELLEPKSAPEEISYELRKLDGSRLIEKNEIQFERKGTDYIGVIQLKDLIQEELEYSLEIRVKQKSNEVYYYYTKVIETIETNSREKIEFVKNFHENTFDKEKKEEIIPYIEPNSMADNTTFNYVDIHSNLNQIMWGDLQLEKVGDTIIKLQENSKETATITVKYLVEITRNDNPKIHLAQEYYRIRYGENRVYLLDFVREIEEIPNIEQFEIVNNKIELGITSPNMQFMESTGGDIIAFVSANSLYTYNANEHKVSCLYNPLPKQEIDLRYYLNQSGIKILSVEESGNIRFIVYGYNNFGKRESQIGIQVYYYDSRLNTIEEEIYIPYSKSEEVLKANVERLAYISKKNLFYIFLDSTIYEVDMSKKTYEIIVEDVDNEGYYTSDSQEMLVWENNNFEEESEILTLIDLNTREESIIKAPIGDYINAFGFIDNDLVYGLVNEDDIYKDTVGKQIFPKYALRIINKEGEILKNYSQEGIYISDCEINSNYLNIIRVQKESEGDISTFKMIESDQIVHNMQEKINSNELEEVAIDVFQRMVQIKIDRKISDNAITRSTPQLVLYEENRTIDIEKAEENPIFYVYGRKGVEAIYKIAGDAVLHASRISGTVVTEKGDLVWQRGNLAVKNQIMAIKDEKVEEGANEVAVAINTMLQYEGIHTDTNNKIIQKVLAKDVLQTNLLNYKVLDLEGCNLEQVLFYVNKDLPVLALLDNEEALLITGFNKSEVVIFEPSTGKLAKHKRTVIDELIQKNGNHYITYYPNDMEEY